MHRYWTILITNTIVSSIINQWCADPLDWLGHSNPTSGQTTEREVGQSSAESLQTVQIVEAETDTVRIISLIGLVTRSNLGCRGVIFLSGDVHYAEKMKVDVNCSDLGYPVYEFTSSGLTHSCDANVPNCNFFINKFFKHMYHVSLV